MSARLLPDCSVMFERLAENGKEYEEETREHVNEYADAGLRTLILAYRKLSEEEYRVFNEKFSEAKNSVSADRQALIDEVTEEIEKDMILLGATAVEDKLQQGVRCETIVQSSHAPVSEFINAEFFFSAAVPGRYLNASTSLHKRG